jgi:hypothetical protein
MTGKRCLENPDHDVLKRATRRQIKACGGLEAAATMTRVGKTELGYYQGLQHPDRFAPIDVVADLMANGGGLHILDALAGLADCSVERRKLDGGELNLDMASFGEHASATFRDYAELVAHGGVSEDDTVRLDGDLDLVIRSAMEARYDLRRRRARSNAIK